MKEAGSEKSNKQVSAKVVWVPQGRFSMKMGTNYLAILGVTTVTTVMSCTTAKKEYMSYELYPVRTGSLIEMEYTPEATKFTL